MNGFSTFLFVSELLLRQTHYVIKGLKKPKRIRTRKKRLVTFFLPDRAGSKKATRRIGFQILLSNLLHKISHEIGNVDGDFAGGMPNESESTSYEEMDGITRTESASSALSLSGTYETRQDYIDALNANGEWVTWDEETGKVTTTSVAAFTVALKNASKSIAAFDQLDRGQGENTLFGYGDGSGAHFEVLHGKLGRGTERNLTRVKKK